SRPTGAAADPRGARARAPPVPTDTSPRGCARADAGRGWSPQRAGWCAGAPSRRDEREIAHTGDGGHVAVHDGDGGARREVLATDVAERDGPAERERPRRRRDAADLLVLGVDPGSARRHSLAFEHEAGQRAIHVAAILDPRHDLLPDVAAFVVAHELFE